LRLRKTAGRTPAWVAASRPSSGATANSSTPDGCSPLIGKRADAIAHMYNGERDNGMAVDERALRWFVTGAGGVLSTIENLFKCPFGHAEGAFPQGDH
jgi:hypothetical protein